MQTKKEAKKNTILLPFKEGDVVEGEVIGQSGSAMFLDLGAKGTGIIYGLEFNKARGLLRNIKTGDTLWAKVKELDNDEGYVELSASEAQKELVWKDLEEKKEKEENIKVKILGANKGGLLSEVLGVPAFLPVSQLASQHYPKVEGGDKLKILQELQKIVGQKLEVKIIDLDAKHGKLIISEKAMGEKELKETLKNYKNGDKVKGIITAVTDFGAFISFPLPTEAQKAKIGTIEGLIHISELDSNLVKDPRDIVKVGEKIEAKIIEILGTKVALSIKALKALKKDEAPLQKSS